VIQTNGLEEALAEFAAERDWDQFHTPKNLALSLVGEVGELCELLQWKTEDDIASALSKPEFRSDLSDEIADVLIYLVRLASVTGIDLNEAVTRKIEKNGDRYPAKEVRGRADKRP